MSDIKSFSPNFEKEFIAELILDLSNCLILNFVYAFAIH